MLDGCILWGARVIVPPPGRDRVIPGTARDTSRNCKNEEFGTKLCVVAKHGCRPGSKSENLY